LAEEGHYNLAPSKMNPKGLHIERRFTSGEQGALQSLPKDPYSLFEYEKRMVEGSHESETIEVEVPKHWSDMAAHILATHYLINIETEGKKIHENSVKQVVARLSNSWARWGFELGYFASWEDAQALQDETAYMLLAQMAAPNSPQWFNTGIYTEYGIKGQPQGHYMQNLKPDRCSHPHRHGKGRRCMHASYNQ